MLCLGIKCNECDVKQQSRKGVKRHMQLFIGGGLGRDFSETSYLQHENLRSEAYKEANFSKHVQKSGLSSRDIYM